MKILIVDDARDMRLVIQHQLKKLNHDVDTAVDGEDAWNKLQENHYQVVISDWVMPKMDGIELCKRIREASFQHYIYIILLTGMSGKKNIIHGIEAGADDFTTKPVQMEELDVRLRSAKRVLDLEYTLAEKNQDLATANKLIKTELENAAATQIALLPAPIDNENVTASWLFKPAVFVGGDTFNYYIPSKDILVFFSVDISGHGVSSAILTMSLQASLALKRGLYGGPITRERIPEIPEIFATNLNEMLLNNDSNHYLTMIFGIIDFQTNELYYVQAGHPYPFWVDASQNTIKPIEVTGFPVGLFDGADYETHRITFDQGDKFILYSDGISENDSAINGEVLETDNLHQHFEEIKSHSANDMLQEISTKWLTPEQMNQLPDDVSVLIFEFK